MSFFKKFDSFFSAVKHYLAEVFDDSTVESRVTATLNLLTPAVQELVSLAGGPGASAVVTGALAQFKSDYATLCAIAQGSFPAPGANAATVIQDLLASLKDNLAAILADIGVKNLGSFSKISGYATFFVNEAEAILSELAPAPSVKTGVPAPVAEMPSPVPAIVPAPETGVTVEMGTDDVAKETAAPAPAPAPAHVNAGAVKPLI